LARAATLELPTWKGRAGWEFTDLGDFTLDAWEPAPANGTDFDASHLLEPPAGAVELVQVDGASTDGVSSRIVQNGDEAAAAEDATEVTGDPIDLVRHVATVVGDAGEALRAGEVVICGSVVPALSVAPGDTVEVQLDPLGSLRVRFL